MMEDIYSDMTPDQFELEVKGILQVSSSKLEYISMSHHEVINAHDGSYEIDLTARFEVLGADILVLIECKHHKSPIKREVVQVLHNKVNSIGAQKGMIFSTAPFQRGAIKYATRHGIALVHMVEGKTRYMVKAAVGKPVEPPPWANIPKYVGLFITITNTGNTRYYLGSLRHSEAIDEFLGSYVNK